MNIIVPLDQILILIFRLKNQGFQNSNPSTISMKKTIFPIPEIFMTVRSHPLTNQVFLVILDDQKPPIEKPEPKKVTITTTKKHCLFLPILSIGDK